MKKCIFVALFVAIVFLLSGCKYDAITGTTYNYHEYIDSDTGVNYIVVIGDNGIGISPRYNADGSMYISEIE